VPRYSSKFANEPLCPYVSVRLSTPSDFRELQGILDTGADQTLIPLVTANALRLRQIGDVSIGDASGDWNSRPVYTVQVEFEGLLFTRVPVAAINFPVVLIGRDILNDLVVTFDGPRRTFTISRP